MELPNFPVTTKTRAGSDVILTGYYSGYTRPWVGFVVIKVDEEGELLHNQPCSWTEGGFYLSKTKQRSLDITLPIQA